MTEKLAFMVFAAFPVPTSVLIIAGLVVAIVIFVGAILLFRSPGKNKGANANKSGGAPGWQPQGQQQATPGGWNQAGMGGSADNAWGQQQQASTWGPQQQPGNWGAQSSAQQQPGSWGSPQQQPGNWGAQSSAQQQPGNWGSQASPQQQSSTWGNASPSTPSANAGMGGNQSAWDATLAAQQPAASQAQDPWGQPPASSVQQGAPVWGTLPGGQGMPASNPSQQQQAPTSYGGSGSGQSWGQSNQPAPAQQAWGQPLQPQVSSTPSPATGANQGIPSWQQGSNFGQGQGQGQGFGSPGTRQDSAGLFTGADNDRTMLRPSSPQGTTGIVRVEEGKEPGRVYEVRKDELSIGRSRESDIFLEDLAVSRLHAKILSLGNGNYALKDEGSANGTKVNGQLVNKYQTYPLQEGDKIQLGQTVLVFARR